MGSGGNNLLHHKSPAYLLCDIYPSVSKCLCFYVAHIMIITASSACFKDSRSYVTQDAKGQQTEIFNQSRIFFSLSVPLMTQVTTILCSTKEPANGNCQLWPQALANFRYAYVAKNYLRIIGIKSHSYHLVFIGQGWLFPFMLTGGCLFTWLLPPHSSTFSS